MLYFQQASFSAYAKNIIVKLDVFPWHGYRDLQNYSFVFSIYPEREPDDDLSYVDIKIIHDSKLQAMNKDVFKLDKYIFTEGSLIINEVIEIVQEETRFQTQYVAILKKQVSPIKGRYVGTRNVLLFANNLDGEGLSDRYSAYYAKGFEASVAWQKAELEYYHYMEMYFSIHNSPIGDQFKKLVDERKLEMKAKWELYLDASKREYLEL
ncbi:hypothetical protein HP548_23655 [Paenibacillus taichungensis]|uniref:Uncharacterized protein n=1 Tax=Paenibacillus taichungensis TaxID=484184 RepID=A0ABX2MSV4_9BACL|nr:hypothetical protein [Paenibacillus taichungensis]NUU57081.1 hypothetical protein [Paenibacillus taichungensis]